MQCDGVEKAVSERGLAFPSFLSIQFMVYINSKKKRNKNLQKYLKR